MAQSYFTPKVFTFLKELANNNDRAWWEQNKDRYIEVIREPAKAFIEDFGLLTAKRSDFCLILQPLCFAEESVEIASSPETLCEVNIEVR